ncbi:hypothetical protein CALCODRAFT_83020 [Calocera cornea HHB12733]|uniref:Uncharacterized protein n=1 Tax=Calocera cornea HHB12733 TaxID=1353952 RepID=A0A165DDP8_9BASI|nr:hypothetical protein CALCODRAFT_83020 [Calocera cornea HHB12733]
MRGARDCLPAPLGSRPRQTEPNRQAKRTQRRLVAEVDPRIRPLLDLIAPGLVDPLAQLASQLGAPRLLSFRLAARPLLRPGASGGSRTRYGYGGRGGRGGFLRQPVWGGGARGGGGLGIFLDVPSGHLRARGDGAFLQARLVADGADRVCVRDGERPTKASESVLASGIRQERAHPSAVQVDSQMPLRELEQVVLPVWEAVTESPPELGT